MKAKKLLVVLITLVLGWSCLPATSTAQEASAPQQSGLADQQQQVTERYRRLEELLLRLADVEAEENAERAALLRRAAKQSRDMFVLDRLSTASQSLRSEQFKNAIDSQNAAKEGLDRMLSLLLSEDRPQRIRDEKERVGKMIKELKLVERLQKSTRARTENGIEFEAISEEQQQIGDRAEKVRQSLDDDSDPPLDAQSSGQDQEKEASEAQSPAAPPADDQPPGEKPAGDEPAGDEPADAAEAADPQAAAAEDSQEQKRGEQKPAEPSDSPSPQQTPSDSSSEPSQPAEPSDPSQPSQPSDPAGDSSEQPAGQSDQQPQSPEQQAQQQLQKAIEKMRQAEKELEQSQREGAMQEQQQAEENLRAAIDRLEKILRQLREEEMQRELARLEARLRKMAQMQAKVLDDTKLLDAIPVSQRDRQVDVRAGNLAFEEKKIIMEADRAMLLLREEGSSVAFPEVVAQIRGDMQRVAERLTASKIDAVTIGLQDDILAALEEMIAALQKAQRDLEKQQQENQQQQPQQGQPSGEQPLVEQLAELRLIRTMETRIMSTTERYSRMVDQSEEVGDVLPLIRDLAERQSNLYRITRDIVQQRNQ